MAFYPLGYLSFLVFNYLGFIPMANQNPAILGKFYHEK
jgi:hypothetical protein